MQGGKNSKEEVEKEWAFNRKTVSEFYLALYDMYMVSLVQKKVLQCYDNNLL